MPQQAATRAPLLQRYIVAKNKHRAPQNNVDTQSQEHPCRTSGGGGVKSSRCRGGTKRTEEEESFEIKCPLGERPACGVRAGTPLLGRSKPIKAPGASGKESPPSIPARKEVRAPRAHSSAARRATHSPAIARIVTRQFLCLQRAMRCMRCAVRRARCRHKAHNGGKMVFNLVRGGAILC